MDATISTKTQGSHNRSEFNYASETDRCTHDINAYLSDIESIDISDVSFSQDLQEDRLRCATAIEKISQIECLPILTMEPKETKSSFYKAIREKDVDVAVVEGKAIHELRLLTGLDPINVGSFGLMLNISSSDIDLGIGVSNKDDFHSACTSLLSAGFKYKQARDTRFIDSSTTTKRFVFSKYMDNVEIDVSVYHSHDLYLLSEGGAKCRTSMSDEDRAEHTWNKNKLKNSGMRDEYNIYKLKPYIEYKPGFKWVAIQ